MAQHVLRVSHPVVEFESLIAAVRHQGMRVGWLELPEPAEPPEPPGPVPVSLANAADFGVLRAVGIAGRRSVAVKPMRGEPVLGDVLREHFRGCHLVLVLGGIDAPSLQPGDGGWLVRVDDRQTRWSTEKLVAALAQPRPW